MGIVADKPKSPVIKTALSYTPFEITIVRSYRAARFRFAC